MDGVCATAGVPVVSTSKAAMESLGNQTSPMGFISRLQ